MKTMLHNSKIYGEAPALDCPPRPHDCVCPEKTGFLLFGSNEGKGKDLHILMGSARPHHKIKGAGVWNAITEINKVTFEDFLSGETECGA